MPLCKYSNRFRISFNIQDFLYRSGISFAQLFNWPRTEMDTGQPACLRSTMWPWNFDRRRADSSPQYPAYRLKELQRLYGEWSRSKTLLLTRKRNIRSQSGHRRSHHIHVDRRHHARISESSSSSRRRLEWCWKTHVTQRWRSRCGWYERLRVVSLKLRKLMQNQPLGESRELTFKPPA